MWRRPLTLLCVLPFLGACGNERAGEQAPSTTRTLPVGLEIPDHFPIPRIPEENPSSIEKIELGRWLFYDRKLSGNGEQRCADCHQQRYAFTDGRARAVGSTGALHPRGSMSLVNIAYAPTLGWADPTLTLLEDQALIPMFGEDPVELGLASPGDQLLERLRADSAYRERFAEAFAGEPEPITLENLLRALAAFQRALISANSPFDRYLYQGDQGAVSDAAKRGFELFMSERLECFHCHGGFNFSDSVHSESVFVELGFHNTGLYKIDARGSYPPGGEGLYAHTRDPADMGHFNAPTLRNIAVTAPYMHDGSVSDLDAVIDFYSAGGRLITEGERQGDGRENPLKSGFVVGFELNEEEREALLAFLESLTDQDFLESPRFADPFEVE